MQAPTLQRLIPITHLGHGKAIHGMKTQYFVPTFPVVHFSLLVANVTSPYHRRSSHPKLHSYNTSASQRTSPENLQPCLAPGTATRTDQCLRRYAKLGEDIQRLPHGETYAFHDGTRQVSPAVPESEADETSAGLRIHMRCTFTDQIQPYRPA